MITLNLISESLKKEIKFKHLFSFFKKIDYIILIVAILISIMLLTTKFLLSNRFSTVVEETTLINKNSYSYNSKVKEINDKIKISGQIQDGFIFWSAFISDLSLNIKEDISLSYLKIDQTTQTLTLRGHAKNRDSLLALKNYIETSNTFRDLNFPVSNLLDKTDISFEITAKINLDKLQ